MDEREIVNRAVGTAYAALRELIAAAGRALDDGEPAGSVTTRLRADGLALITAQRGCLAPLMAGGDRLCRRRIRRVEADLLSEMRRDLHRAVVAMCAGDRVERRMAEMFNQIMESSP